MNSGLKKLLLAPALAASFFLATNDNAFAQQSQNYDKIENTVKSTQPTDDMAQDASKGGVLCFVVYLDPASRHLTDQKAESLIKQQYAAGITRTHRFFFDRQSNNEKGVFVRAYNDGSLKYPHLLNLDQLKTQVESINNGVFNDINKPENTVTASIDLH